MTRSTGWDWTRPQLRALGHCVYHIHTVAEIQLVDGKNPNRLPCWRISQPSTVGNSGISKYINPYSGDHPELTAFFGSIGMTWPIRPGLAWHVVKYVELKNYTIRLSLSNSQSTHIPSHPSFLAISLLPYIAADIFISPKDWLLLGGWAQPLWKIWQLVSWDDEIPKIWKNKIHVPNHQPGCIVCITCPPSRDFYVSQETQTAIRADTVQHLSTHPSRKKIVCLKIGYTGQTPSPS